MATELLFRQGTRGGSNADIVNHADLPNPAVIDDVCNPALSCKQSDNVLYSQAIEHVEDSGTFFAELNRIPHCVNVEMPSLWDTGSVLNFVEPLDIREFTHSTPQFAGHY